MQSTRVQFAHWLALVLVAAAPWQLRASTPNPLALRPHHITASVVDLDRAAAWYQNVLGFAVRERGHHGAIRYVELSIPGFGVALIQDPASKSTSEKCNSPHWLHIVFTVPDPSAAYESLKRKGARLRTRDDAQSSPLRSFLIDDSEGNEIEIVGDPVP